MNDRFKKKLTVAKADFNEGGQDMVRINLLDRPQGISRHDIVRIEANSRSITAVVLGNDTVGEININIDLRNDLGVTLGKGYEFTIHKANWCGRWGWYANATNPAVRLPAHLSIWSFALGVISLLISVPSLWLWAKALFT
ncbi:hypothetical protein [Mesorhizobium sp. M0998]|uniref:hypothetical protein n=1 Tax=Mesorhizobium sp. M0998 TaxID=2957044 RepID=UPI00333786B8